MSQTLLAMGFQQHIVALLQALYSLQKSVVQVEGDLTEWFSVGRGVRQGCILSPALFNLYSEALMRNHGVNIGGWCSSNLCYADDVALITEDKNSLQDLLININAASQQYNLDTKLWHAIRMTSRSTSNLTS